MKNILWVFTIAALSISCGSSNEDAEDVKEDKVVEAKRDTAYGAMIHLDTAEDMYNILCQDWVLADDAEGLEGMTESSKFEIPYRSFYFSTEGSFVKNPRNEFDYGTWSFDEATKIITLNQSRNKKKDRYKIARLAADEMVLVHASEGSNLLKFIGSGKRFKNAADEPYFLENNRWRIKPAQKETESAIHQRLKDNIRFFMLFYKSALAKNDQVVSFWGLPSCFKWYGGGVFLKKKDELQANWIDCYYNKEQAMQAYDLASRLMSQKYEWPKGEDNWIKQNLFVVEQMYEKIDGIQ